MAKRSRRAPQFRYRLVRGPTGLQLRQALARLGLTQMAAARRLGVDGRTVRKWIADEAPTPHMLSLVLHCWQHHHDKETR